MITADEASEILSRAYVPEHAVGLMTAVSGGEPFLVEDYFCCRKDDVLIVVGYPLGRSFDASSFDASLKRMIKMFGPTRVSLIAPELPPAVGRSCRETEQDYYFTLDLPPLNIAGSALRAAGKAAASITVEQDVQLTAAHRELAEEFVERVNPPPRVKHLMFGMWNYVGRSAAAVVLSAWKADRSLAAFHVVDFSPADCTVYVIGCHSKRIYVLGASDLLFREMIRLSEERGKKYIHLGLGVNDGIRRFKQKWGGLPGLKYCMCELVLRKPSFLDAIVRHATKK